MEFFYPVYPAYPVIFSIIEMCDFQLKGVYSTSISKSPLWIARKPRG
jgi:hypothetical protein